MSLGNRIASMRGFRQMSQSVLGGLIGVSKQAICNWEKGRSSPDAGDIRNLCIVLGCTADYLLGLADDPSGHVKW